MAEQNETTELLMDAALTAIQEIQAVYWRQDMLVRISPYLPSSVLDKALSITILASESSNRVSFEFA
jgi:hypothetical protein